VRIVATFCALMLLGTAAGSLCAGEKWPDERNAGPFLCHADFSLELHKGLLTEVGALQRDIAKTLGNSEPREHVHLFLFEKKETYQTYMQRYFPRVPARRALYIKGRGPGMVFAYQGTDFEIDVRHESTHAILHASYESVPLWLDEGLAEYFEVPENKRASDNPHLATTRALLREGSIPKLKALEELRDIREMGRDEYRDAWAWVHFMIHGPRQAHEELVNYLNDLQSDAQVGKLSDRLYHRFPDLERRLSEHFRP
jgi:hypothetical protein